MSALLEYQRSFIAAIFDSGAMPDIEVNRADAGAIYRNNFFSNLSSALAEVYPVVCRLVGSDFFVQMTKPFISTYPSRSGDIQNFGAEFADFICAYEPTAELAYLPEVARLEWLCHKAFHAADCGDTAIAKVLQTPHQQYGQLRFVLHPACHLHESGYPVAAIRRANQPGSAADEEIELADSAEYLLVRRPIFEIEILSLPRAQFIALEMIACGSNLETAIVAASEIAASFDVQNFMALLLSSGVAVDCFAAEA